MRIQFSKKRCEDAEFYRMFTGMSKSRRPWSTSIMTVMAVTDWLILAILEMEFYRVKKMTFRMLLLL